MPRNLEPIDFETFKLYSSNNFFSICQDTLIYTEDIVAAIFTEKVVNKYFFL